MKLSYGLFCNTNYLYTNMSKTYQSLSRGYTKLVAVTSLTIQYYVLLDTGDHCV